MIRFWFLLVRRRFIVSFAISLLFVLLLHIFVSGESITDIGVFWHHFCGCPVDPADFQVLLNFPVIAGLVGFIFGLTTTAPITKTQSSLSSQPTNLFLFTRPVSRATVF